jgi:hypothetical protein
MMLGGTFQRQFIQPNPLTKQENTKHFWKRADVMRLRHTLPLSEKIEKGRTALVM